MALQGGWAPYLVCGHHFLKATVSHHPNTSSCHLSSYLHEAGKADQQVQACVFCLGSIYTSLLAPRLGTLRSLPGLPVLGPHPSPLAPLPALCVQRGSPPREGDSRVISFQLPALSGSQLGPHVPLMCLRPLSLCGEGGRQSRCSGRRPAPHQPVLGCSLRSLSPSPAVYNAFCYRK